MSVFEYIVIPAPERGEKAKGAKSPTERYAVALAASLNEMAAQGWEYLRAEALPSEERSGLTGRATMYHNMLIFRRPLTQDADNLPEPAYGTLRPNTARPFSQPMRAVETSSQQKSAEKRSEPDKPAPATPETVGQERG